ncbi:MAG: hypothetical protein H6622_03150 [Halobacteriovoraceae bacterium]|nr:hypothetical protein [Halobacteriovoraceae bacterium]
MNLFKMIISLNLFISFLGASESPGLDYFIPGEYYLIEGNDPCTDTYVGTLLDEKTGQIDFMLGQNIIFSNVTNKSVAINSQQNKAIIEGKVKREGKTLQRQTLIDAEIEKIRREESITFDSNKIKYQLEIFKGSESIKQVKCFYMRLEK